MYVYVFQKNQHHLLNSKNIMLRTLTRHRRTSRLFEIRVLCGVAGFFAIIFDFCSVLLNMFSKAHLRVLFFELVDEIVGRGHGAVLGRPKTTTG